MAIGAGGHRSTLRRSWQGKSFGSEPLERFLERLASAEPAPGGGSAAAVTAAVAAGLVAMAARLSDGRLDDADAIAATADGLRRRALALADDDAARLRPGARRLPPAPRRGS